jgi:HrpA-like RNA helicase
MKQENKELAVSKDLYKTKGFERKVIFATNVAESSITFDGLVYVIDTGLELASYYDYKNNSNVITKMYISQAQIKQRIGRAGRTQPGVAYHLYNERQYGKLKLYPIPNINMIDLTSNILSFFKNSRILKNIIILVEGLITIPLVEHFIGGLYKLHFINAIKLIKPGDFESNKDSSSDRLLLTGNDIKWDNIHSYNTLDSLMNGTATTIGHMILKFRSSPIISALAIIMSYYMDCQNEMICIMAISEITDGNLNSLFQYNKKIINVVQSYFKQYVYDGSDHLTAYNIYTKLYLNTQTQYLNRKTFKAIQKRIQRLETFAASIKKEKYDYIKEKYNIIQKKPYTDFIHNIIYVLALSHYYNLIKQESTINYTSLNFLNNSKAIVEYCPIMPDRIEYLQFAICDNLVDAFGRKSFKCITCIPSNILLDLIKNENLYVDHSKLIKKTLGKS